MTVHLREAGQKLKTVYLAGGALSLPSIGLLLRNLILAILSPIMENEMEKNMEDEIETCEFGDFSNLV